MEKVFENKHLIIYIDKEKKFYIEEWKPESSNKSEQDWYNDHEVVRDTLMEYKPEYIISYSDKTTYPVSPEMQKWYTEQIVIPISGFVKKAAVVMPDDFIAKLSLEQLISEVKSITGNTMTIKYFDSRDEALKWLGV